MILLVALALFAVVLVLVLWAACAGNPIEEE